MMIIEVLLVLLLHYISRPPPPPPYPISCSTSTDASHKDLEKIPLPSSLLPKMQASHRSFLSLLSCFYVRVLTVFPERFSMSPERNGAIFPSPTTPFSRHSLFSLTTFRSHKNHIQTPTGAVRSFWLSVSLLPPPFTSFR